MHNNSFFRFPLSFHNSISSGDYRWSRRTAHSDRPKRVEEEYANEFKRIANKEGILYRIAEASIEHPDEPVRKVVFEVASETLLRDLIKEYKAKSEFC